MKVCSLITLVLMYIVGAMATVQPSVDYFSMDYKLCNVTLPYTSHIPHKMSDRLEIFSGYCQPRSINDHQRYWCNVYNSRGQFFYSGGVENGSVEC